MTEWEGVDMAAHGGRQNARMPTSSRSCSSRRSLARFNVSTKLSSPFALSSRCVRGRAWGWEGGREGRGGGWDGESL